ncbi:DoxX [Hydrogenophaga taeniospiralis CCUG 15921]|uniref:DoxX n=2 Tax=Hydrogenophaga TaxID=47420 RepID=A0A9X4P966_9BURK|nr:DoxX [Hydrogenophaga taeniospiralis CCUG 15921]
MNTLTTPAASAAHGGPMARLSALLQSVHRAMGHLPNTLLAFIARFSIAAVFWKSGQTKIEGLAIDIVSGEFTLGMPRLSDNAVFLFQEEYKLPVLSPELGATLAALGEHILPVFILLGLATRLSALGLLGMTLVIQLFVYPDAYPTHGTWAAVLLYLMAHGPGKLSIDAWIARRCAA